MPQETKRVPLASLLETRDDTLTLDGLLTNCYAEQGPVEKCIVKRPGLELAGLLLGDCPGQGAYYFAGESVFIKCDTLYKASELVSPDCVEGEMPDPRFSYSGEKAVSSNVVVQAVMDPITGYVWAVNDAFLAGTFTVTVTDEPNQVQLTTHTTTNTTAATAMDIIYVPLGETGREIWVLGARIIGIDFVTVFNADTLLYVETFDVGYFGTGTLHAGCYNPVTQKVVTFQDAMGSMHIIDPMTRALDSVEALTSGYGIAFIPDVIVTTDFMAVFSYGTYDRLTLVNLSDYTTEVIINSPYSGLPYSGFSYDPIRERLLHNSSGSPNFSYIDLATETVTIQPIADPTASDPDYSNNWAGITYSPYNDCYIVMGNSGVSEKTSLWIINPVTFETEVVWTYEPFDTPSNIPSMMNPAESSNYMIVFDVDEVKRYYLGVVC